MVQLKVTDGHTTRMFCLQPGEDSYQLLKQRLATFFPESVKEGQQIQLHYTDSDGDLITVTTDSEFTEALAQLPAQAVWKIRIQSARNKARHAPSPNCTHSPRCCSSVGRLGRVVRASQRNPWLPLSLFPYSHTHPQLWDFPSWSSELDDVINHTSLLHNVTKNSNEAQSERKAPEPSSQGDNIESAKNKLENSEKDSAKVCQKSSVPGMRLHKFGSWEPRQYRGEFGTGTVVGPVGYYATWRSGDKEEDKFSSKMEKTGEEGGAKEEGVAKQREGEGNEEAVTSSDDTAGHPPDHVTDEPDHVDDEPDHVTDEPDHVDDEPDRVDDEPDRVDDEPDHVTDEPDHVDDEPDHAADEPDHAGDEPAQVDSE